MYHLAEPHGEGLVDPIVNEEKKDMLLWGLTDERG